MLTAIRAHHAAGKPLLAECGGMLYLLDSLTDVEGTRAELVGLLAGDAVMQKKLAALALQSVELPEGVLRGHTYHHSLTSTEWQPIARGQSPNGGRGAEAVFRQGRMTASYVHFYFPSNPSAIAALFAPDRGTAFASRLALPEETQSSVGAGLLAKAASRSGANSPAIARGFDGK